ncbi:hypothetical protein IKP85_05270 [bacterium]|nr:hypothetical protein [bacterium]
MRIAPVKIYPDKLSYNKTNRGKEHSVVNSYNSEPSFNANMSKLTYQASLDYHFGQIHSIDPYRIEQYFANNNIQAFFREGTDYGKKMVAYCCYQASEIFKQLHYPQPRCVGIADFRRIRGAETATGLSFYASQQISPYEVYRPLTAIFNTFHEKRPIYAKDGKAIPVDWEHFIEVMEEARNNGFLSTNHFMSPFIHEYAHNLHYHKIYSKFGAPEPTPGYAYNPNVLQDVFYKMNKDLYQQTPNTNYIANYISRYIPDVIAKDISYYGSTALPEAFAEAFTKEVVKCLDPFSLRLVKNPFPMKSDKEIINKVLYETYEGLVGDGKGVV